MCGIIGAMSLKKTGLAYSDISAVKELLVANTVRGYDATGLFWHKPTKEAEIWYRKDAVTGAELYKTRTEWSELNDSRFVVGHNRAATMGGHGATSAHPFITTNVVGVHNGTVRGWEWDLKDHKQEAKLDSEAIMMALSSADPELEAASEVLAKIEAGAYAVVWWDARVKSLRFARNGDRPLFMCTTPHAIWWASELRMLEWILDRNNYSIKNSWDLKSHTILSLPIEGGDATYCAYEARLPRRPAARYSTDRWVDRVSYYRGGWDFTGEDDDTLYPSDWQAWAAGKQEKEKEEPAPIQPMQITTQAKAGYLDFNYRTYIPTEIIDKQVAAQIYSEARELAGLAIWNTNGADRMPLKEALDNHILMGNQEAVYDKALQATLVPVNVVDVKGDELYGYVEVDNERIAVSFGMCDKELIDSVSHVLISDKEAVVHNVEIGGIRIYHHGDVAYRVRHIHGKPYEVWVGDSIDPEDDESAATFFGTFHPDRLFQVASVNWEEGWSRVKE